MPGSKYAITGFLHAYGSKITLLLLGLAAVLPQLGVPPAWVAVVGGALSLASSAVEQAGQGASLSAWLHTYGSKLTLIAAGLMTLALPAYPQAGPVVLVLGGLLTGTGSVVANSTGDGSDGPPPPAPPA